MSNRMQKAAQLATVNPKAAYTLLLEKKAAFNLDKARKEALRYIEALESNSDESVVDAAARFAKRLAPYVKETAARIKARIETVANETVGEVIEAEVWLNKTTGATASVYGAVPWTGSLGDTKEDWERESVGWTIRQNNGTIGIGREPFKSESQAEAWLDKENARMSAARLATHEHNLMNAESVLKALNGAGRDPKKLIQALTNFSSWVLSGSSRYAHLKQAAKLAATDPKAAYDLIEKNAVSNDPWEVAHEILVAGVKHPALQEIEKSWRKVEAAFDKVGRQEMALQRSGVGMTESLTLLNGEPMRALKDFQETVGIIIEQIENRTSSDRSSPKWVELPKEKRRYTR